MAEAQNYKDTINLPKTDFPMKGNLPQNEPKWIAKWQERGTYDKMVGDGSKPSYTMPDGPPYANGNIHIGHTLNKVLKDIVIKYQNMKGHRAAFVPGWDCHGLPIEMNVTKKLGKKRFDLTDEKIRELCREEAKKWVNTQKDQFERLGVLADWDNPYLTLQPEYEAEEIRVLAKIFDNGILVRGEKPVYWCPALQTALAAAEVEYHDHKSPSIYTKFNLKTGLDRVGNPDKPVSFVIWTTTPWTLPANYGIALHPNFNYGLYDTGDEILILAEELSEKVAETCGFKINKVGEYKGSEFEGLEAEHPFINRTSKIILGEHVTTEAGTGCVHTAPGHGLDDYVVGKKYGLPVKSPVDAAGKYTSEVPEYEGVKIWEANKLIVDRLVESGHMLYHTEFVHSYPHNPRSKTPLIFRATPQWFISMDDEKYNLRKMALDAVEKDIEFVPDWGAQRIKGMLSNSPDWCVSRQRLWGVPIPVLYCKDCGHHHTSSELMNRVADGMESSGKGIEDFYSREGNDWANGHKCEKCGSTDFDKGKDILDVWFDSGVCHTAVQKKRDNLDFPADIYLEGSDQHRGWFQTSLVSSLAAYGESPFKALVTHGFVNDAEGKKMSKSKGNVIDPAQVIKKSGAEILRLWVAYEDYGQDVNISDEMFQRVTETYRRIRNTMRFLLGNLNDFDPAKDSVDVKDMPVLDQWALHRLNTLIEKTTDAYDSYNFYRVYHALNQFFTVDMSATYLDILKDRLYTGKSTGNARRSSQTVIYLLLNHLTRMMAPILSFLGEEVYSYLPVKEKESVFEEGFPKTRSEWSNPELAEKLSVVFEVRDEVAKKVEGLRVEKVVGSSLDSKIGITATGQRFKVLKEFENELRELLIVSQVSLTEGDDNVIEAGKAEGEKCVRCWHYSVDCGKNEQFPGICPKCVEALS